MGLYQPTVITPSSLNGTGVIDATQDMTVTWQINGTVPIRYWQFVIMRNDSASTVLYTSDWRYNYIEAYNPSTGQMERFPVDTFGRDPSGNLVPTTDKITAADLATAGVTNNYANGYKLKVNQKYMKYSSSTYGALEVLEQISPSYFIAVDIPSIATTGWTATKGRYAQFDPHLTSNIEHYAEMSDPIIYKRQRLAYAVDPDNHIIEDSGNIVLPSYNDPLAHYTSEIVYGILKNHTQYAFRMDIGLESGSELTTGWVNFGTSWTDTALDYVHLRAYYVKGQPAVFLRLEVDEGYSDSIVKNLPQYERWTIYRVRTDTGEREKVGIIPPGDNAIYDFGLRNNTEYNYRAYYGLGNEDGYMYETENPVKLHYYWNWALIEAELDTQTGYYLQAHAYTNTIYKVVRVHQFQGNVVSGSLSNENAPYVADNFTPYPTVQKSSRTGLSGTLKAWVGKVRNGVFTDSIAEVEKIMALSTRETVKFLKDRKGNLWRIEISGAIQQTMQDEYAEQPVEIQIPWVEVGDAKEAQIVSLTSDGVMAPGDDIVDTESSLVRAAGTDTPTGDIEWTREEEGYVGSEIGMDANGRLTQTYNDDLSYVPAALSIVNGNLVATTVVAAEE